MIPFSLKAGILLHKDTFCPYIYPKNCNAMLYCSVLEQIRGAKCETCVQTLPAQIRSFIQHILAYLKE